GTDFVADAGAALTWRSTLLTRDGDSPGVDSWVFTRPTLEQGKTYLVRLRVTDVAGNIRTYTIGEGTTFIYDAAAPRVTILEPNAPYERTMPPLSGSASDVGTSISLVQVSISSGAVAPFQSVYWNGTSWQVGAFYFNATPTDGTFNSASENWHFTGSTP